VSVRRLLAIAVIFFGSTTAWVALGSSVLVRTGEYDYALTREVALLWGGPHIQRAPVAEIARPRATTEAVLESDSRGNVTRTEVTKQTIDWSPAPLMSTRADVALDLEHRRKGLLWYDTYEVAFRGAYVFENPDDAERPVRVKFKFPAEFAIYDDFTLTIDGVPASRAGDLSKEVEVSATIAPRGRVTFEVGYRSRGLDDWKYAFAEAGVADVRDFQLAMRTNFRAIDFPPGSVSPAERIEADGGWRLAWTFSNLVTGQVLGMDLPNRLNPGPLAARITFFAPVSLLFFLMVMVMLDVLSRSALHPMNYFFISAAFFAFHLLLAYLVDHVALHLAFALAALASVGLVISYLRVVAGMRQRLWQAGAAQAIYLVAFSYAFFFEGLTGLTVTVGAVLTLFVLMQMTAGVDWTAVFERRSEAMNRV
jgi:hypothetical protein